MTKFNKAKFESEAKKLVAKYSNYEVDEKEVSIVLFRKSQVYVEAMLRDLDDPGRYFDVTYFGDDGVYNLDVYRLVGWSEFHEEGL